MSSDGVLVTPVELNRNLLNSFFKFKPQSKLELFIMKKKNILDKKIFTLAEVLTYLKEIIRGERLFDLKNPSIIICDNDLEDALNMKALHVTEIRDLVLAQLTKLQDEPNLGKFTNFSNRNNQTQGSAPGSPAPQRLIQNASTTTQVYINKKAEFTLKPKFLEVVRSLPNTDPKQIVFSYEEVTLLLSTYILAHKEKFFDCRNIKLAMVAGDPLGEAFGVRAFHRCQVNNLLKNQLIPHPGNTGTDTRTEVRSNGSAAVSVSISEMSVPVTSKQGVSGTPSGLSGSAAGLVLPAFPALNKAHSTPVGSSSGNVRKRSDSESEGSETRNKQARTELRNLVIDRPGSRSDYTNTRNQRRGEENATIIYNGFDKNFEEAEDDDADDESDSNFQQEFDVESGSEEEERPPQAMGGGNQNSTDSESGVDGSFQYLNRKEVSRKTEECKEESVYWADCEREKKDLDSCDSEQESAALRKCLQCGSPNKPYVRYCGKCWRERKGWVSTYERKKKRKGKSKEEKIVYRVDTDTETDSAEKDLTENKTSSQDSLDSLDTNDRTRMNSQDSGISSMDSQELELLVKSEEISEKPSLNRSMSLDLKNVTKMQPSLGSPASSMDSGFSSSKDDSSLCLLCCTRKKDSSLVHGKIGHQVCCYPCAKKLWRRKAECPVCRRTVERIIKLIQA